MTHSRSGLLPLIACGCLLGCGARAPLVAAPYTIVAFGDSTTAPRGTAKVYPTLLQSELQFAEREVRVINAGVGGDTTEQARARLNKDVLGRKPDLVLIQFGINDASVDVWKRPPASRPRVSKGQYEKNLREMVKALRGRGVAVILMTPNPMRWTPGLKKMYGRAPYKPADADGLNVLLREYAEVVRKVAREEKVPLADVYRGFEEHGREEGHSVEELLADGMHPSDRGHRAVADVLLPRIARLLSK